jgi:hypothetical protein
LIRPCKRAGGAAIIIDRAALNSSGRREAMISVMAMAATAATSRVIRTLDMGISLFWRQVELTLG